MAPRVLAVNVFALPEGVTPLDLVHNALAEDDLSKLIRALSLIIHGVDGSKLRLTRGEVAFVGSPPVRVTWLDRVRSDGSACPKQVPIKSNSIGATTVTQFPALLEETIETARKVTLTWAGFPQKEEQRARASALLDAMSAIGDFLERRGIPVAFFLTLELSSRTARRAG